MATLVKWLREEGRMRMQNQLRTTQKQEPRARIRIYLPKTVRLRDYQIEALKAWYRSNGRGIVILPTGTGKTFVGSAIAYQFYREKKRVAILVPTQHLAHQWLEHFEKWYGIKCGIWYAEKKKVDFITVVVYNSALMRAERVVMNAHLVVIDEIHHFGADRLYKLLYKVRDKKLLGLTATLTRSDGRHHLIKSILPVVYVMGVDVASERGIVAKTEVIGVPVTLSFEYRVVYDDLSRAIARYKEAYEDTGDEELKRRMMILVNKRKQLLAEVPDKLGAVLRIVREEEGKKILVFTESIRSAEAVADFLRRNGVMAGVYHSKMTLSKRREALDKWGRRYNVLVAVRALDEGIDVPECSVGVIMATGTTTRQLVQRVGRIVRPRPGKVARIYVVFCRATHEERAYRVISKWFGSRPVF